MRVDKIDAARRQLEVASGLYFADGDILAVHTLAAAGHEILRDLNKRRMALVGEQPAPPFYNVSVKDIPSALAKLGIGKAESPKLLVDACNEAENFLKHADRDWGATLEIRPEWTQWLRRSETDPVAGLKLTHPRLVLSPVPSRPEQVQQVPSAHDSAAAAAGSSCPWS